MVKKKTEEKKDVVEIRLVPLNMQTITVPIEGTTDLWMDKFPEETMKGILDKQCGISKGGKKKIRDTKQEIKDAIHHLPNGKVGFPVSAFKAGMCACTSFLGDKFFSKKLVSGAVRIINAVDGLIEIKSKKMVVAKHSIGSNMKFTPAFQDWSAELVIKYDANNISSSDIVTLLNYAGFYVGVGANRPKGMGGGSGEQGCFKVKIKK